MGMFDTISVSDALPYTQEMIDLGLDKNNHCWQTKDLSNAMSHYFIQGNKLFEERYKETKWIEGDKTSKNFMDRMGHLERNDPYLEPVYHHGEIYFYDYVNDVQDKWDCWLEFKAVFTNGSVERYELVKFTKTDNAERKERDKEFRKNFLARSNKWYNKYIFYTRSFRWFQWVWNRFWMKLGDICHKLAIITY